MKKLSIEEKAKRYDEILARAEGVNLPYYKEDIMSKVKEFVDYLIPELAETEDERIRESIIDFFSEPGRKEYILNGFTVDDIISWLEKQGERKSTIPKWKYKNDNTPLLRDSIILNKYGCVAKSPSGALVSDVWVIDYDELAKLPKEEIEKQDEKRLYTSETMNEKRGFDSGFTRMMENEQKPADIYCQKHCKGYQETGRCFADGDCQAKRDNDKKLHQETKEAMSDNSVWSEEDEMHIRELESLVKQVWAIAEHENDKETIHKMSNLSFFLKTLKPQLKQEWSEEDEKYSSYICAALDCYYRLREDRSNTNGQEDLDKARNWIYNKLKSLRPQIQLSKEDIEYYNTIITILEHTKDINGLSDNQINFLRSFISKNHWKTSEEQIEQPNIKY